MGKFFLSLVIIITYSFILNVICFSQWQACNGISNQVSVYGFISSNNIMIAGAHDGSYYSNDQGLNWTKSNNEIQVKISNLKKSGNSIFASTLFGMYRSTNNGQNWIQSGLNNLWVYALDINANGIFAGGIGPPDGVFRSTNNGYNWTNTNLNYYIHCLALSGNYLFAGSEVGIFVSTDCGSSWNFSGLSSETVNSIVFSAGKVFAGTNNGLYTSSNNGVNWSSTAVNSNSVFGLASYGSNIFAGTNSMGIYQSSNYGSNWVQINQGFQQLGPVIAIYINENQNDFIYAGMRYSPVYRRPLNQIIGISELSSDIPLTYSLSQNFPNPFNPETRIRYSIRKTEKVKLTVLDIQGRVISRLVNGIQRYGTYEVTWNSHPYSSGTYFYTLETSEFRVTRKMIVLK